jgi:molecular chaperone DnaK (HSP70)
MLGKTFNEDEIKALKETKFVMNDFVADDRGFVAWEIFSLDKKKNEEGEKEMYYTEEILAMILKYGRTLSETQAGGKISDCVITVPNYFSRAQRHLFNQAAELAGLNILQMVHENTAAATYFGLERMDETPLNVMIYNMGAQDTEVSIARFAAITNDRNKTVESIEILSESADATLGGKEFDDVMVNMLAEKFNAMKER